MVVLARNPLMGCHAYSTARACAFALLYSAASLPPEKQSPSLDAAANDRLVQRNQTAPRTLPWPFAWLHAPKTGSHFGAAVADLLCDGLHCPACAGFPDA